MKVFSLLSAVKSAVQKNFRVNECLTTYYLHHEIIIKKYRTAFLTSYDTPSGLLCYNEGSYSCRVRKNEYNILWDTFNVCIAFNLKNYFHKLN